MAIHKTPELVGDVLQCCAKHIEEQKKRGVISYILWYNIYKAWFSPVFRGHFSLLSLEILFYCPFILFGPIFNIKCWEITKSSNDRVRWPFSRHFRRHLSISAKKITCRNLPHPLSIFNEVFFFYICLLLFFLVRILM